MNKAPARFKEWLGPWRRGECHTFNRKTKSFETEPRWVREYRMISSCNTDGCCEIESIVLGPLLPGNTGP